MELDLQIKNQAGLHARPAAMFVQRAASFKSNITISKDNRNANAKSIIGILGLGITQGDHLLVKIDGPDAEEAGVALKKIVAEKFGEA
jgi:phosphocarrier protein